MKINDQVFKFPNSLPNDVQGFIFYYPNKFPPVVPYFEEVAKKIGIDPTAYKKYGYWAQEEMYAGFEKIIKEFEKGDQESLEFLVEIDQKLNKLFCYRFWLVNYLFADGPIHEYYVDNLKNLVRKVVDITEDIEDYEQKVLQIQRDLMQTDYADLYLQQALKGVNIIVLLLKNPRTKPLVEEALTKIKITSKEELEEIWKKLGEIIMDESDPDHETFRNLFLLPLNQVKMRKSMTPLYAFLTHTIEFKEENEDLTKRYDDMKGRIKDLFNQAQANLDPEDFELFKVCYDQSRNLSMFKDVMGDIDPFLLPFWFGTIHRKMKEILSKTTKCDPKYPTGHGSIYSYMVWFLPKDLKDKVMTPDYEPYVFEGDIKEMLKSSAAWNTWDHPRED